MDVMRILAVEDNPADFRLLKEHLGEDPAVPFEVVGVQTIREALDLLPAGDFAAVLLDLNLPDSTGLAGLDRIVAGAPALPVIVLTGLKDIAMGLQALSRNAQDYLVKDRIDGDTLVRSIRYAIERGKARETAHRQNVELEKRAATIEHARQEWERTFDAVPDLIAILDERHQVLRVNRAMARKLGREPDACRGATCYEVVHGCRAAIETCPHARTMKDGKEHSAEVHEDRLGGDFHITTTPVMDADGRMVGAVHVARDITKSKQREADLRRLNRVLNALGHSGQALMRATGEADFLAEACRIIVEDCGHAMVWIGFAEHDEAKTIRPAASAGFEEGYLDALKLTWADTERGRGPTGMAIRTGQVTRCLDIPSDPAFLPWRQDAIKRGYASSIALPLLADGKALGALCIYSRDPVGFGDDEVKLLTDLAADFAQNIVSFRTRAARDRAEQAVRESEERYRSLFNTMAEGFAQHAVICDSEGKPCDYRFLDINPAFERLTGLKREQVVGKTVLEIMPETEPVWIERFGRVGLTGEPDHFSHVSAVIGRHFEVAAYQTAPGRFAVIFTDVTELKAFQERDKANAVRLAWGQAAIDTISVMYEGVALLEDDGTILSVNPAVERLTGLAGDSLGGRNVEILLPELLTGSDLATAQQGLETLRSGEMPKMTTLTIQRRGGGFSHVLPSLVRMAVPDGVRPVVVLTLWDVTELHEAAAQLKQSERKYRELVENANSIIMRILPDHTITFFNEYAQTFFGFEAGDVVGRNVLGTIAAEVDSEGRDMRAMLQAIMMHPEQHGSNESENVCKDGRRVWVHWANRAVRDDQGQVVEILCVGTDITRRRAMEAETRVYQQRLRELAKRLATAEEADRWRISRYIHDTIIQNLSLSIIRLGSIAKPLADARRGDEVVKLGQIRGLIEQSIGECRMVMSDLTPALLYELGLIPALNDLAQQLETKHRARLVVKGDGQEPFLSPALRGLLFQSVRELVMNALKHAGPCEISVTVSQRENDLVVQVADDGAGFDPSRAGASRDRKGGFGLFSIRQRLEGLGGRLEIDSTPGKGTTATIDVPVGERGEAEG